MKAMDGDGDSGSPEERRPSWRENRQAGAGEPAVRLRRMEQWVDQYVDRLTRLAFIYVRDWPTAEDVVQEAFLKAFRAMDRLQSDEYVLPWLMRIVINESRSLLRKTRREHVTSEVPAGVSASAETDFLRAWEQRWVAAVMALPERYRTPVYLFYVDGMATEDIAAAMGIRPGTVRVRLLRGRKLLQRRLQDAGAFDGETPPAAEGQSGEDRGYSGREGVSSNDPIRTGMVGPHPAGGARFPLPQRR